MNDYQLICQKKKMKEREISKFKMFFQRICVNKNDVLEILNGVS